MNVINVINPYKWNGMWVFDDPAKGLDKEPLVCGADTMMDILAGENESAMVVFSSVEFPDHHFYIDWAAPGNPMEPNSRDDGDWYIAPEFHNHRMWLCPALLKYFDNPPSRIYVKSSPSVE
jgi:hypothetical protein